MKSSELDPDSDYNSERKPSATDATTQIKPEDSKEPEEGEHLFHS